MWLVTCNQLQDQKIILLMVRVMKHSDLALLNFSPRCLEFASPNLRQFQCEVCHPVIFDMRNGEEWGDWVFFAVG